LSAEILPLLEACVFLEKNARRVLAPRQFSSLGQPLWLRGVRLEKRYDPFGVVLIVGPANYPLFLPGVQSLQALVAGNAILVKPGTGARAVLELFRSVCLRSGLDPRLFTLLNESPAAGEEAVASGVDKVFFTGSEQIGQSVLGRLAAQTTPAVMELSGCDAAFVLADADPDLARRALVFGLTLNGSATCIAPRRVFVDSRLYPGFSRALAEMVATLPPCPVSPGAKAQLGELINEALDDGASLLAGGFRGPGDPRHLRADQSGDFQPTLLDNVNAPTRLLRTDVLAPVMSLVPFLNESAALELDALCPFALGASVFAGKAAAEQFARKVSAGVVVVNDMIVPTAHPRVSFGGRDRSGYGKTRGEEGLLEFASLKWIATRAHSRLRHLESLPANAEHLLQHYLSLRHRRSWKQKLQSAGQLWKF
jgi:acyl-CoA reductase-like NAD-dependent aldehyde dehydrogenase